MQVSATLKISSFFVDVTFDYASGSGYLDFHIEAAHSMEVLSGFKGSLSSDYGLTLPAVSAAQPVSHSRTSQDMDSI